MTNTGKNQPPSNDEHAKQGITNHPLEEEQSRQAKVLPFREREDKKETDRKTK